jgi:hypothetical protein
LQIGTRGTGVARKKYIISGLGREPWSAVRLRLSRSGFLMEHDPFGKSVTTLGSSPRADFFRIMLC